MTGNRQGGVHELWSVSLLLPTPFPEPVINLSGAQKLMAAVLDEAIQSCAGKPSSGGGGRKKVLIREAWEWIESDAAAWPFSFVVICHALGFDPDWLRLQIQRRYREAEE